MKRATVKDIATYCGISIGTVDRVLHKRGGVSAETTAKVEAAIQALQYTPNHVGRAMACQHKNLHVAAILYQDARNTVSRRANCGLRDAAAELRDMGIELEPHYIRTFDVQEQLDVLEQVQDSKVDGLIIKPMDAPQIAEALNNFAASGRPIVTCSADIGGVEKLCSVGQDHHREGRMAAELLYKTGAHAGHILLLVESSHSFAHRQKIAGIREYWMERGLSESDLIQCSDILSGEATRATVTEFLKTDPHLTGIVIISSFLQEALQAVHDCQCPAAPIVISFEYHTELYGNLQDGTLDFIVEGNPYEHGYMSMRVLFEYLFYGKKPMAPQIRLPSRIRTCESMGADSLFPASAIPALHASILP